MSDLAPEIITPVPDPGLQSPGEELANALTHGLSALLALAGMVGLIVIASSGGDPWRIVASCIYGTSLALLYIASACYHTCSRCLPKRDDLKHRLRVFDHASIYVLIAGTYTPIVLVPLRGPWGWSLFGVLWGLALVGVTLKLRFVHRFNLVFTLIYIAMGWIGVIAMRPMLAGLGMPCIAWLVAGGLAYTGGVAFYLWEKLPYNHAIWHLFVTAGSVCHFLAVLLYIVPV